MIQMAAMYSSRLRSSSSMGLLTCVRVKRVSNVSDFFLRQVKRLDSSRNARPISSLSHHSAIVILDVYHVNQAKSRFVFEAFTRAFSVPSIFQSACQICAYHTANCFSSSSPKYLCQSFSKSAISNTHLSAILRSSCGLEITASSRTRFSDLRIPFSVSCRSIGYCNTPTMGLRHQKLMGPKCSTIIAAINAARYFHSSCSFMLSVGAAPDMSCDGVAPVEQPSAPEPTLNQKIPGERTLKLYSGSCYFPHPDKEDTGGEDAHFICIDEHAIGVADGVGGWAELGIDAGKYARALMSNSVRAIEEEPKGCIDPARVLEKAYAKTKAEGSSTACIIALTCQGLQAINLGDSGFIVVRDGCTIFKSPVQQHAFNFTYQLACGSESDLPSSGEVFTIPIQPGDVVVAGTDGLFDNLYNNEVTAVVVQAIRTGLSPQATAQKIAALARRRAQDRDRRTPFSAAAEDAGYLYYGGKLDDITVVVSYITCYSP